MSTPATTQTADVVVDYGDGRAEVRRVPLPAVALNGLEVLSRTGIALTSSGGAVCAIGGQGCPASNCFCACQDATSCRFWSYAHGKPDASWEVATTGPVDYTVHPGDVEGWVWGGSRPPLTATAELRSALLGETWLAGRRLANGSQGDHPGLTAEGVIAARSVGRDVTPYIPFLASQADAYSKLGAAQAGKLAVAVAAADLDPRSFGGIDLVKRISDTYNADTGQFGASVWDQSWAILGLADSNERVPDLAGQRLVASEVAGGGWTFSAGGAEADADSTGLALQADRASMKYNLTNEAIMADARAVGWLRSRQNSDGGWGHGGEMSNVNSTAYALQGIRSTMGEFWHGPWSSLSPLPFLLGQQRPAGNFQYDQPPSDLVATLQTVPAAADWPLDEFQSRAVAARTALAWVVRKQNADGSFGPPDFADADTIGAVLALAANGRDGALARPVSGGPSVRSYLETRAATIAAQGAAEAGSLMVAAVALGANPRHFGGTDLVQLRLDTLDPESGIFTGTLGAGRSRAQDQAWSLLGLAAAREPIPPLAVTGLLSMSMAEGGWRADEGDDRADVETTGLVLQALAAADVPEEHSVIIHAVDALRSRRYPFGWSRSATGWLNGPRSLSFGILGLIAYGQDVGGTAWRTEERRSPWDDLLTLEPTEGGSFPRQKGHAEDLYTAALAFSGRPLPFVGLPRLYVPRALKAK